MVEAITLCEAKNLDVGRTVYAIGYYNRDGTAQKFIVQEEPKVWKRNADRVEITLKRGLKELVTLTELCLDEFSLEEPERLNKPKKVKA
jgi:hypothetical protein